MCIRDRFQSVDFLNRLDQVRKYSVVGYTVATDSVGPVDNTQVTFDNVNTSS